MEYPVRCLKNIRTVMCDLMVDAETAYAMLLMMATMMDLRPDDPETAEMVCADNGAA